MEWAVNSHSEFDARTAMPNGQANLGQPLFNRRDGKRAHPCRCRRLQQLITEFDGEDIKYDFHGNSLVVGIGFHSHLNLAAWLVFPAYEIKTQGLDVILQLAGGALPQLGCKLFCGCLKIESFGNLVSKLGKLNGAFAE